MASSFSFGSYFPGESPLHRLDARTKLLCGVAFIVVLLASKSPAQLGLVALFTVALYAIGRIPPVKAAKSLAPLMAIVVIVALLNLFVQQGGAVLAQLGPLRISEGGVAACAFMACRLTLMMLGMSLITLTTMTLDLTEAVEKLLAPLARVGLPAHELGMIMGIALRFMPQFAFELTSIYRAQISRGAALEASPVKGVRMVNSIIVPLFTSAFRHAETLSAAMDARCYHGGAGRTRLHPLHFAARDAVAAGVMAALAAALFALGIM
ncbi:MAG: energy-coupling factor transporter transmembrane component T [Eggerthellaceae bacterium]|nr:energy-coupling factor transporter transmembrane component T [Eggerthellaceae bacterium]